MADEYNPALNDEVLDFSAFTEDGDETDTKGEEEAEKEVSFEDEDVVILSLQDRINAARIKLALAVYRPNSVYTKSLTDRKATIATLARSVIKSKSEMICNIHQFLIERKRAGEDVEVEEILTLNSYSGHLVAFMHRHLEKYNANIAYMAIEPEAFLWARFYDMDNPVLVLAMLDSVIRRRAWLMS